MRLGLVPAVVAAAPERRGPHAIPTYAIRVADDFHRFYHEHRVLESEQRAFRLALCAATQVVVPPHSFGSLTPKSPFIVYFPNRLDSVEEGGVNGAAGAVAGACARTGLTPATQIRAAAK